MARRSRVMIGGQPASRLLLFIAAVCFFLAALVSTSTFTGIGPAMAWLSGGLSAAALAGAIM